jgi:hypothetical protein
MSRQLLRAILAFATFSVVWLVVSPASAMSSAAPVCDPRGAIMFAPPPQIQDEERSIDIPADCVDVNPLETHNVVPGRGAPIDLSSTQEPVATDPARLTKLNFALRLPMEDVTMTRLPPGVRSSLDRPPRS